MSAKHFIVFKVDGAVIDNDIFILTDSAVEAVNRLAPVSQFLHYIAALGEALKSVVRYLYLTAVISNVPNIRKCKAFAGKYQCIHTTSLETSVFNNTP